MDKQQVLSIIRTHQSQLSKFGVKHLILFGSVARDEAQPDSDVDLLVEFDRPVGLLVFADLHNYLEEILGCSVDLGTFDSLKPHLREPVSKDSVYAL